MTRKATNLRLLFDASLCDGHGICALQCPELISLDEWGYAHIRSTRTSSPEVATRARRAVRACPNNALKAVEGSTALTGAPPPRRAAL